ncbi:hypothetical protein [Pasteurella sp. PK-2025]|uniref:hypothetical protein n=1 Tax=Pasteurella sp. PK-2025 TaxID=3413133 RepID=UPI003C7702FF
MTYYFFNYLFYYTRLLIEDIGKFLVKPIDFILYKIPYAKRNKEKIEKNYNLTVNDLSVGSYTIAAYNIMLTTITINFLNFFILSSNLLDINIINLLENWFGELEQIYNVYIGGFGAVLLSILINEKTLGWHSNGYVDFFKSFDKKKNKRKGYCIICLFHLSSVLLLIFFVFYFY